MNSYFYYKKIILLFLNLSVILLIYSQEIDAPKKNIPFEIQKAFNELHSNERKIPKIIKWSKQNNNYFVEYKKKFHGQRYRLVGDKGQKIFHFSFKDKKHEYTDTFSNEGIWLLTEGKIQLNEIPGSVINSIKNNNSFNDWKIVKGKRMSSPSIGLFFEITLEKDEHIEILNYDNGGKILQK